MKFSAIEDLLTLIQPMTEDHTSQSSDYTSYKKFFLEVFPNLRRDIFSGELMTKNDGLWESARSHLSILRSYADDTNGVIKPSRIADHLARFQAELSGEILVDIPAHESSLDYLRAICDRIHPTNVSREELYELILGWGANMWRRFYDPTVQNQILILQSGQGVGKDYLLRSMLGGLEQFFINFTVNSTERDNLAQLNQGLVINISEFDRTARLNTGLLKDMITRDSTFIRLPYDKSAIKRLVRCSFVGSCNTKNFLTDTTGNRRFIVLEIEKIDFDYPTDKGPEILSQFQAAAKAGYETSLSTKLKMTRYIESITPREPSDLILSLFDDRIQSLESEVSTHGIFQRFEIDPLLHDISLETGISKKKILSLLQATRRSHRTAAGMIYGKPDVAARFKNKRRNELYQSN